MGFLYRERTTCSKICVKCDKLIPTTSGRFVSGCTHQCVGCYGKTKRHGVAFEKPVVERRAWGLLDWLR